MAIERVVGVEVVVPLTELPEAEFTFGASMDQSVVVGDDFSRSSSDSNMTIVGLHFQFRPGKQTGTTDYAPAIFIVYQSEAVAPLPFGQGPDHLRRRLCRNSCELA